MSVEDTADDIAIVGVAGRFPGANNVTELWQNVLDGRESMTRFSDAELIEAGVPRGLLANPKYVKVTPALTNFDRFDAKYFSYSPREAALMDPQHRLVLQTAVQALNDASLDPARFDGRIGVFAGAAANTYMLSTGVGDNFYAEYLPTLIANDKDFLATRISFKLNLTGPSITVQTACSTSLVAVHLACQSLMNMESDAVLAGGVSVRLPQNVGYLFEEGSVFSPDGHCRPFDARAQGTIFGSGVAMILLKRLEDALNDKDNIYAVIKGSAINNDGSSKADYTAPSVSAQSEVIAEALTLSGLDPTDVGYVEAHGTGTFLGDPIEVEALTQAFDVTQKRQYCAIGSIKANIGHLDAAAGVTGLIKAAMAVKHGILPPAANYDAPNPQIDFQHSPFYVNQQTTEWKTDGPRVAGVSSLGIGGTNAHVVIQSGPDINRTSSNRRPQLFTLSAKDAKSLERSVGMFDGLEVDPGVTHSLWTGRPHFKHRTTSAQAVGSSFSAESSTTSTTLDQAKTIFLFPGNGSQHPNMGAALIGKFEVFTDQLSGMFTWLLENRGLDLKEILFSGGAETEINRPSIAMPALFTVEVAMARQLMHWGVEPSALCGHSIGEYSAAHLSGVFSLEDALNIVSIRGALCERTEMGAMLAVNTDLETVKKLQDEHIAIAAINGPDLVAVSGSLNHIDRFASVLDGQKIGFSRLKVQTAYHSSLLDEILDEFRDSFSACSLGNPSTPIVSNVTGDWATVATMTSPDYWVEHLRNTVRYADNVATLSTLLDGVFVEVGPGRTLTTLTKSQIDTAKKDHIVSTMRHPNSDAGDELTLIEAAGRLWSLGVNIDVGLLNGNDDEYRVPLPAYQFDEARHWYSGGRNSSVDQTPTTTFSPSWTSTAKAPTRKTNLENRSLVIATESFRDSPVLKELLEAGTSVSVVFANRDGFEPTVDGFAQVLRECKPEVLLDLQAMDSSITGAELLLRQFFLFRAYTDCYADKNLKVACCTLPYENVATDSPLHPDRALLIGPTLAFPLESPNYDMTLLALCDADVSVSQLLAEAYDQTTAPIRVIGKKRWTRGSTPALLSDVAVDEPLLSNDSRYLITGGFGGIGRTIASHLVSALDSQVLLTHRRPLTPEDQEFLKQLGGKATPVHLDIVDSDACAVFVNSELASAGKIQGVFHTAGRVSSALVDEKSPEDISAVLAPKVEGTHNALTIARELGLAFVSLFSSVSSFKAARGDADYASANAYLDALAEIGDENVFVQSINWSAWERTGMVASVDMPGAQMAVDQCLDILSSALNHKQHRLIVAPTTVEAIDYTALRYETSAEEQGKYIAPDGPVEEFLAQCWKQLLGLSKVSVSSNFLEIGGDSLLATRVLSRVADEYDVEIGVKEMFEDPVLRKFAERIEDAVLKDMGLASTSTDPS